ncbi:MAG: hypothetical protein OHK0029_09520 [Armatimonadaceae bacterium]
MPETTDRMIVEEMWTRARNEPLTMGAISPFGIMDRDRYRRQVGDVILELTLDSDPRTRDWSYELGIRNVNGEPLDADTVNYWLQAFFGREAHFASRRNFLMAGEARFVFPYAYGK